MTLDDRESASRARSVGGAPQTRPAATLYFIDIPNSGGSHLRPVVEAAFEADVRVAVYDEDDGDDAIAVNAFERLSLPAREQLRLVMGRFQYGVHERTQTPFRYATLIRHPIDRVLAFYSDYLALLQRRRTAAMYPAAEPEPVSLNAYVFDQQHLSVDNGLVRAISGRRRVGFGACSDGMFDEAMSHIEVDFDVVLVNEEPVCSFEALRSLLGQDLPSPGDEPLLPAPIVPTQDAMVMDRIRDLNRYDMRLYDLAQARLKGDYSAGIGRP